LFTKENDWVLDPFAGAGTTCQVAQTLLRNSAGIEILPEYYQLAQENIKPTQYLLFEEAKCETHYTTRDRSQVSSLQPTSQQ
jgi:DNA modification methylase